MIGCCDSRCVQLHAQEHLPLVVTPMSTTNTVSDHCDADLQTFVARSFFFPTHHIHLMPSGGKDTFTATSASISLAPKLADFVMPQPPLTPHDTEFDPQAAATVSAWHTRSGHVLVKPKVNGQDIGYMLLDTGMFSFAHTSAAYALRKSAEYAVNTSAEYGFHTSAEYGFHTSAEYAVNTSAECGFHTSAEYAVNTSADYVSHSTTEYTVQQGASMPVQGQGQVCQ